MSQKYTEGYYSKYGLDMFNGVEPFVVYDSHREYPEDDNVDRETYRLVSRTVSHGYFVRSNGYVVYSSNKNGNLYLADSDSRDICLGEFVEAMSDQEKKVFFENFSLSGSGELISLQ